MPDYNKNGFIFLPDVSDAVCAELPKGIFSEAASHLKGSGKGVTKLLSDYYRKCKMEYPVLNQGNIGTCTAVSTGGGIDLLKITEIANGERSEFKAQTCSEAIYYGARKLQGWSIRGDGSSVALAIKYIANYGTIARGKYGNIDVSEYSVDRARRWGQNSGFPKTLEDISKDHKIEQYSRVRSYEEIRDSIANDCPVIVGSSYGYNSTCNNDGVAKQDTSWNHCLRIIGIRGDKDLVLIDNTWGPNWNRMPVRKFNEPLGSFWVKAEDAHKMAANGDAWSISSHQGYPLKVDSVVAW